MKNWRIFVLSFFVFVFFFTSKISTEKTRVLLFGVDGYNPSCNQNATSTKNIDWLKNAGSSTDKARTIIQTVSAPGWTSIMCSMDGSDTGVLENTWLPPWKFNVTNDITPITGNQKSWPCIFQEIKTQNSNLTTAFYHDWSWLNYMSNNYTTDGNFIDDLVFCYGADAYDKAICDAKNVALYIKRIEQNKNADFTFLYIGALDEAGHEKTWCSPLYESYIGVVDDFIGLIKDKLEQKGQLQSTYIILTSDHGSAPGKNDHGEQVDSNIFIPFYIHGPGVKIGKNIDGVHNMDTAPTILKFLGLSQPVNSFWRGRPISGISDLWPNKFLDDM